ncbi:Uncharacterized protein HZ326_27942 [Fusarium oxysporum f. sp. albedinis]|nr:Uncharacterized protein HZ326_28097 [Fusarium oxysporum f. sp. albedinis]KAJ0128966.1 Uncharacterized protein HZ326_27942 [Fusarium oxysporum f. sp. albedinis]
MLVARDSSSLVVYWTRERLEAGRMLSLAALAAKPSPFPMYSIQYIHGPKIFSFSTTACNALGPADPSAPAIDSV